MALTMKERQSVTRETAIRYRRAKKKKKGEILDGFVTLTGYNRCYAAYVLRNIGKGKVLPDSNTVFVVAYTKHRRKPKLYGDTVKEVLEFIWRLLDRPCGKRLSPYLSEIIPVLKRFGEIDIDEDTQEKLLKISAATIDRILAPIKKKDILRPKSYTKPGSLLKSQIPIRTFTEWDDTEAGFIEIDLVGHDGGNTSGDFCHTLDATCVATTWTETIAVKNKAQKWVFEAIQEMRNRFPFPILGIDSDNGGEFINNIMHRYCLTNSITFTRSRPNRKNDNCYVEQKNYSIVRQNVGYFRYDTKDELLLLNELYRTLRLFTNFFQPSMKLVGKVRIGSKVTKTYDTAKTPYMRVLDSKTVSTSDKERLCRQYDTLNPVDLKRTITRLQDELVGKVAHKMRSKRATSVDSLEYVLDEATNTV
jgi:hypothetical protein